jgi:hypothetical protein
VDRDAFHGLVDAAELAGDGPGRANDAGHVHVEAVRKRVGNTILREVSELVAR